MKTTFDKEADAVYIYFKDISPGEAVKTSLLNESVNMDLDSEGKAIGIEILEASKNLPPGALKSAVCI